MSSPLYKRSKTIINQVQAKYEIFKEGDRRLDQFTPNKVEQFY
jgi:hypothetical protein